MAGDTDTVAAIAGALVSARWGASAVPARWRRLLHGWPGITGTELGDRGLVLALGSRDSAGWPGCDAVDYRGWCSRPVLVEHPADSWVLLGNALVLDCLPPEVDAVVSLCRVGRRQPPGLAAAQRVVVRLIDKIDPGSNPHLDFVLADTADVIASLRSEGHTLLVHCVPGQSRTPTVATAYAVRHLGRVWQAALDEVLAVLPGAWPSGAFRAALGRLAPASR